MKAHIVSLLLLLAAAAHAQSAPDTIYTHAKVLTAARPYADSITPGRPDVTAIAVSQGKITATGSDSDLLKLKGAKTKIVDLNGAFVMPGFIDAHTHMGYAGQQKLTIDLDGTTSLAEMQQRIRDYAAKQPAGAWLQGAGWDHTKQHLCTTAPACWS